MNIKLLKTLDIDHLKEKAMMNNRRKNGCLTTTILRARNILRILERDNFKCVKCGETKNLTIDHINGRKFAKHNNDKKYKFDKCQTLCEACHLEKNKKCLINFQEK